MMATWTSIHPSRWTTNEVSNWILFVARKHGIDDETSARHVAIFDDVRGDRLCSMKKEDFQHLEPNFGELYYDVFSKIFHKCVPPSSNADVMGCTERDNRPSSPASNRSPSKVKEMNEKA